MKRIISLIGICMLILLIGGIYKPLMYRIFNDYEEVCIAYQKNVTAKYTCSDPFLVPQYCSWKHDYISTEKCIEYQLVRITDIEPFIYLFDWCEVYPDSEDCE